MRLRVVIAMAGDGVVDSPVFRYGQTLSLIGISTVVAGVGRAAIAGCSANSAGTRIGADAAHVTGAGICSWLSRFSGRIGGGCAMDSSSRLIGLNSWLLISCARVNS